MDQFLISMLCILPMNGFLGAAFFGPYYFPGMNLLIVLTLGAIPAFAMSYAYGWLSRGIPRSGGDYVWSTRILGPLYASIQLVMVFSVATFLVAFGIWSQFTFALAPAIFGMGIMANNVWLTNLATAMTGPSLGYPLSLVSLAVIGAIALLSARIYALATRIVMIFFLVGSVAFFLGLFAVNPSTFPGIFNEAMKAAGYNQTYNGLIQAAAAEGAPAQFNLTNSLLAAIPWGFLTYTGFNFGSYLAGETKNVKTSIFRALFLAVGITAVVLAVMAVESYQVFGAPFINAASYSYATTPNALPVLPVLNFYISLVNPVWGLLIGVGMYAGWITSSLYYLVGPARMIFAASFDNFFPRRFAEVGERIRSPYMATALVLVIDFVYLTIYWWYGWAATLLDTSIAVPIGFAMPLVATALFPLRKRDLYKRAYGSMIGARKLVFASVVGVASFLFYAFAETSPLGSGAYLGATVALAYEALAVCVGIGVVIYLLGRRRMAKMGISMQSVYSEIPPE
jgi:amino acid transporter